MLIDNLWIGLIICLVDFFLFLRVGRWFGEECWKLLGMDRWLGEEFYGNFKVPRF